MERTLKIIGCVILIPLALFVVSTVLSYIGLLLRLFSWVIAIALVIVVSIKLLKYIDRKSEEKERDP